MKLIALGLVLPLTLAASSPSQIYFSPNPHHSTHSQASGSISLTPPQANAVLAHHLGVAQYEHLPHSTKGDRKWEEALGSSGADWTQRDTAKIVILMECGKEGCGDFIPEEFAQSTAYTLPSLPLRSWTSVLTLHLHRLASSLDLDTNSNAVWGLDTLVKGIKSLDGWMGWVGEELGGVIGWDQLEKTARTTVQPDRSNNGLLSDLDFLDSSSEQLIIDLESLAQLTDSLASVKSVSDDRAQAQSTQIIAIHIKGMQAVSKSHSRSSAQYQRAALLLRSTLSATLAAFKQSSSSVPTCILMTLPPYSAPLLIKRKAWLEPFSSTSQYVRRNTPSTLHRRAAGVADGRKAAVAPKPTPSPVIPSGSTCFASSDETNNKTAQCLGRGTPVLGLTTRGKDCWVCNCGTTKTKGKLQKWAGEGCEKEDLSSSFVLLFFSGLGLLIVLLASVMLLASAGSEELPSTLASVGGGMGLAKRD